MQFLLCTVQVRMQCNAMLFEYQTPTNALPRIPKLQAKDAPPPMQNSPSIPKSINLQARKFQFSPPRKPIPSHIRPPRPHRLQNPRPKTILIAPTRHRRIRLSQRRRHLIRSTALIGIDIDPRCCLCRSDVATAPC